MSYYPTLTQDIERAKQILEKGRASVDISMMTNLSDEARAILERSGGGTIYGADTCAAYKLLESFVEAIEAVGPKVCELAVRAEKRRAGKVPCKEFKPDHNGECLNCDEWMDAHSPEAIAAGERREREAQ